MNTTADTTADTTDARQIRQILAARKADSEARRQARIIRQEWIDREAKGEAR